MMRTGFKDNIAIFEWSKLIANISQSIFRASFVKVANVKTGVYKLKSKIPLSFSYLRPWDERDLDRLFSLWLNSGLFGS
jgi:hypothetical protein